MMLQQTKNDAKEQIEGQSFNSEIVHPSQWVDLFGDRMYRYALLQLKDESAAEDVVQETFVKGIQKLESFRAQGRMESWLFQILRNLIADYFRKQKKDYRKQHSQYQELEELLRCRASDLPFACSIEREEFWNQINECYQSVPHHLLEAFLVRVANPEESIEALCEIVGISSSNFSVRLFRTRLLLRKCLEDKV